MNKKERQARLQELWGRYHPRTIADEIGVSVRTIRRDVKELGLPPYEEQSADDIVHEVRESLQLRAERSKTRKLAKRLEQIEHEFEIAMRLRRATSTYSIKPNDNVKSEATAFAVASDWHIEEMVYDWQVNGLNEFNATICRERVQRFFRHTLKLVKMNQVDTTIDTLVLALLGDFISGSIHDELMEGNRLLPEKAAEEATEHIASGIKYLLANSDLTLVIPCSSGNHGRMTKKVHISTEAGNSLERFMYHALSKRFEGNKRVQFVITDGYHTYIDVYGFSVRFHHGHQIKYYGGVGGISIPLNKAVAAWNKAHPVDLDVCGHFHQFFDGGNWVVNGSLIGYNAFALSIKASPEPPRQAFFLIDKSVGKTIVAPIILTEDR